MLSVESLLLPLPPLSFPSSPLLQYASGEEWSLLCNELAAMLEAAGQWQAATLCFMCAGSIDRVADLWAARLLPDVAAGRAVAPPIPQLQVRFSNGQCQ